VVYNGLMRFICFIRLFTIDVLPTNCYINILNSHLNPLAERTRRATWLNCHDGLPLMSEESTIIYQKRSRNQPRSPRYCNTACPSPLQSTVHSKPSSCICIRLAGSCLWSANKCAASWVVLFHPTPTSQSSYSRLLQAFSQLSY